MTVKSGDFESPVSASSTTRANVRWFCGTQYNPAPLDIESIFLHAGLRLYVLHVTYVILRILKLGVGGRRWSLCHMVCREGLAL
jgi:hypothetical protein